MDVPKIIDDNNNSKIYLNILYRNNYLYVHINHLLIIKYFVFGT